MRGDVTHRFAPFIAALLRERDGPFVEALLTRARKAGIIGDDG